MHVMNGNKLWNYVLSQSNQPKVDCICGNCRDLKGFPCFTQFDPELDIDSAINNNLSSIFALAEQNIFTAVSSVSNSGLNDIFSSIEFPYDTMVTHLLVPAKYYQEIRDIVIKDGEFIEGKMYLWNADIKIVNIDSNLFVVIGGDYIHGMYIGEDHIEKLELTKQKMLKVLKDNNSDFVIGR